MPPLSVVGQRPPCGGPRFQVASRLRTRRLALESLPVALGTLPRFSNCFFFVSQNFFKGVATWMCLHIQTTECIVSRFPLSGWGQRPPSWFRPLLEAPGEGSATPGPCSTSEQVSSSCSVPCSSSKQPGCRVESSQRSRPKCSVVLRRAEARSATLAV